MLTIAYLITALIGLTFLNGVSHTSHSPATSSDLSNQSFIADLAFNPLDDARERIKKSLKEEKKSLCVISMEYKMLGNQLVSAKSIVHYKGYRRKQLQNNFYKNTSISGHDRIIKFIYRQSDKNCLIQINNNENSRDSTRHSFNNQKYYSA